MSKKSTIESDKKVIIIALAESYKSIYKNKCNPLINEIVEYLKEVYPKMSKENREDWAMDLVNRDDYVKIFDMLNKQFSNEWKNRREYDTKSGQPS
jgi:hypothetical protein